MLDTQDSDCISAVNEADNEPKRSSEHVDPVSGHRYWQNDPVASCPSEANGAPAGSPMAYVNDSDEISLIEMRAEPESVFDCRPQYRST